MDRKMKLFLAGGVIVSCWNIEIA